MYNEPTEPEETPQRQREKRLQDLEAAFAFDERMEKLETAIASRTGTVSKQDRWWRSKSAVTILTTIIALIVPATTAITNYFQNEKEFTRLQIEQQNSIRQKYLDRVLRPGIKPLEQQAIFKLLSNIENDSALKSWAKGELKLATTVVDSLNLMKRLFLSMSKANDSLSMVAVVSRKEKPVRELVRKRLINKQIDEINSALGSTSSAYSFAEDSDVMAKISLPRPAEQEVSIRFYTNQLKREYINLIWFEIKDIDGKIVYYANTTVAKINFVKLPLGNYKLTIIIGKLRSNSEIPIIIAPAEGIPLFNLDIDESFKTNSEFSNYTF